MAGAAAKRLNNRECLTRVAEPEPDTSNGDDPGAGTELFAKTVDVGIDGAAVFRPLNVPHFRHDVLTGDDNIGLACQEVKEVELFAGHVDELVVEAHFAGAEVDAQRSVCHGMHERLPWPSPAHDGIDTGDEFPKSVGFDHVIIQAGLQAENPVQLGAASGDRDDRDVTQDSNGATDFKTVKIGQIKIKKNQVGAVIRVQRPCSGIDALGMISMSPQAADKGFC